MTHIRATKVPLLRLAVLMLALAGASCSGAANGGAQASRQQSRPTAEQRAPQELWRWNVPSPGSAGMPSVSARPGTGAAFTYGHVALVVLDEFGTEQWKADRVGLRDVAPLITSSAVLAATDEGVAAFDRSSGRLLWDSDLGDRANTPVQAAGIVVTTTWDGSMVGLDPGDGAVLWRTLLPGASLGPPAAAGSIGALVVATWDSGRRAGAMGVSAADGKVLWEAVLPPGGVSGAAVVPIPEADPSGASHIVVVVAGDLAAHGLSATGGDGIWRTELEGSGSPEVPPSVVPGGYVVVGHRLGGFALLDGATGHHRWSVSSDGAAVRGGPVAAPDHRVAMPLDDGRLILAEGARQGQWRPGPGRVSGVAVTAEGKLVVATRGPDPAAVSAHTGW